MPQRLEFDFGLGTSNQSSARPASRDRGPMRLLVMGNFSGRAAQDKPALAQRPVQRIDQDNFDALLRRVGPQLVWQGETVAFAQLDDFHPDALYQQLALFEPSRQARAAKPADGDRLLSQLLGGTAAPAAPRSGLDALIHNIVAPHIVADTSAPSQQHRAAVDMASATLMRELLHAPAFQSLEAAWRGLQWLVANLELDESLQIHLLDVTRDELLVDIVSAGGQLSQTGLHRNLVERFREDHEGQGWAALVGLYDFGPGETDAGLLAALGLIAAQAGGPLLASAGTNARTLANSVSTEWNTPAWQQLRASEAAPWIGLAAPRMLLRLPYGQRADPIERFAFEEVAPDAPLHEDLLWGNPALALARLLGQSFTAEGWAMTPGDDHSLTDLPAYSFELDGEPQLQACAERYLAEAEVQAMLVAGLMPLLSHRQRNALSVARFQSIAWPAQALAGLTAADEG